MKREEFIKKYGQYLITQFEKEKQKDAFKRDGVAYGHFIYWLYTYHLDAYNDVYVEKEVDAFKFLIEKQVKDLPEEYLINIPKELYSKKVYLVDDSSLRTNASRYLYLLLNRRLIIKQLIQQLSKQPNEQIILKLQGTTKREIWYDVNQELKLHFDLSNATSLDVTINNFCEKLRLYLGVEYWGFVLDYLEVDTGERALIWDPKDFGTEDESKVMALKGLDTYEKCPFFFILCEKVATLKPVMQEMINRGYNSGYYGISMKGYGTTVVIKLLLRLREERNFRLFVLHDLDQNGLQIYFDILKYIDCQSIGVNPEFLRRFNIDENKVNEPFKAKNKKELIKGTINMINGLNINKPTRKKFLEWGKCCEIKKIELNSIAAYNLRDNPIRSKVYDLVDCIEEILKDKEIPWNLNKYDIPIYSKPYLNEYHISRPKFIQDVEEEIDEKVRVINVKLDELKDKIIEKQREIDEEAYKELNKCLDSKNLRYNTNWEDLIKDKINNLCKINENFHNLLCKVGKFRHRRILRKNKNYKGVDVVKYPEKIIKRQSNQLEILTNGQNKILRKVLKSKDITGRRFIKQTPEYKELKKEFDEKREEFVEVNLEESITNLKEEIIEILEEPIDFEDVR